MSASRPPISIATSGNVGDREAVARNKLMSVQFAIHPLKPLINHHPLRLTIFRELLKTALKDWTGILNRAPDRDSSSSIWRFHLSMSACSRRSRPKRFGSG